jgi:UDP-N-acetylmuramoylalanine--D-glutamate ligase
LDYYRYFSACWFSDIKNKIMNATEILASLDEHLFLNKNSKIVVVGLGETGFSVAKFLHQMNFSFAVIDSRTKPPYNDELLKNFPDIAVFTGGFNESVFEIATHLIVSPGISLQDREIEKAIQSGVKLMSDIDLFACSINKPVISITGSNGKSTVTTMLGAMGRAAKVNTAVGGNLGPPVLDMLKGDVELYVIELSSFQLERTSALNATVATVLNISADHMDRHSSMATYIAEKKSVFLGDGVMVLNDDDPRVMAMKGINRKVLTFSINKQADFYLNFQQEEEWLMNADQALMRRADLSVEGLHNVANALAALALGTAVGLDVQGMCEGLRDFQGLAHRMQRVAEVKGVTWVNDSKATNVGACIAALEGYQDKVILIAGGDAKGADLDDLVLAIQQKVKCVILLGKDADRIERAISQCVPSYRVQTMQEAVEKAVTLAEKGESVLLSPACASIDQYKNYEERGCQFAEAVMALVA